MALVLGEEWHISSSGDDFLKETITNGDKEQFYNFALDIDLKDICRPVLNNISNGVLPNVILQIHKIRNISAPKANEESQAAPRMLKLTLTDGESYVQALELSTINTISLKKTPPGTKVLMQGAKFSSGFLLVTPQNCRVLGGKVATLIDKWELTKNVQRNRRNNNEDGPPLWVNFGIKIQTGAQGDDFNKSQSNKGKDVPKENLEFEQQRHNAIAEASSGAIKKVFSGRVKQNVQVQNAINKKNLDKLKEKKELSKGKGKLTKEREDMDDKPQKPSEKVSLFAFLEDKLPIGGKDDKFFQSRPIQSIFKDMDTSEDQNKYEYKRKKTPVPQQFEKPDYVHKRNQNSTKKTSDTSTYKETSNGLFTNNFEIPRYKQKPDFESSNKPKQSNNFMKSPTNNHFINQQNNQIPPQSNGFESLPQNYQTNAFKHKQHMPTFNSNINIAHHQNYNYNQGNFPHHQQIENSYNHDRPHRPNIQNDMNHLTNEVQKVSLNSQFASRSLRQHLNLGSSNPRKNEILHKMDNTVQWNIGDEVLAKYWEDGKYYNASIISITDKTFAVRFKGYGNIEEIFKTDCLPITTNNFQSVDNHGQLYDRNNKQYSGSVEFRRSSRQYK